MPVIKMKPTSPGTRFVVKLDKSHLHKGGPFAPLTKPVTEQLMLIVPAPAQALVIALYARSVSAHLQSPFLFKLNVMVGVVVVIVVPVAGFHALWIGIAVSTV